MRRALVCGSSEDVVACVVDGRLDHGGGERAGVFDGDGLGDYGDVYEGGRGRERGQRVLNGLYAAGDPKRG